MENKALFQEKLVGLLALCQQNGNAVEKSEVEAYFAELDLTEEQMILVFDYLMSQKILVKRYMKAECEVPLTEEEKEYLKVYESELSSLSKDDIYGQMLPEIIIVAKRMNHPEVFIGDLIQEGNMAFMTALNLEITEKEEILTYVKSGMQTYLESQTEMKLQDKKMADKVNHLEEEIKKLTEEMGRKITIDELSQFTNTSEEEIEDILRLAGEEVDEMDEEEVE